MPTLCDILDRSGSDKTTVHSYGPVYEAAFAPLRATARYVLEIGVAAGHSLRAWRVYFPHAAIVGLDASEASRFTEERIYAYTGDQNSVSDLLTLPRALNLRYDIVIDDGNHRPHSQLFTLFCLLPYVRPGGLYCIEDITDDDFFRVFAHYRNAELFDLRGVKGRFDDRLVILRKEGEMADTLFGASAPLTAEVLQERHAAALRGAVNLPGDQAAEGPPDGTGISPPLLPARRAEAEPLP